MAEIQLRNVSFNYDKPLSYPVHRIFQIRRERNMEDMPREIPKGVAVLEDLNLTIPDGQTFVVVGPSGCGKSTLLRVVSGLEQDYSGQVLY
ncbi:MAG TPA: ATP-binding cassette domain-containing protein, partial [Anaerolineales bacterium]|nr:ATP-binding cassette domain-containing protein [Anaerolineales bacterium]